MLKSQFHDDMTPIILWHAEFDGLVDQSTLGICARSRYGVANSTRGAQVAAGSASLGTIKF